MSPADSKGKRKATERTPLLDEHGNPTGDNPLSHHPLQGPQPAITFRRAWRSHLLTATLVLLTVCFGLLLAIILLVESYAAPVWRNIDRASSQPGGDKFWKEAVPMRGPDAVKVVGINRKEDEMGVMQLQVNVSLTMHATIDTDFLMGFRNDDPRPDGWWTRKWKDVGRWGVRRLGSTTAMVDSVVVYPSNSAPGIPLLTIKPLSPVSISLSPGLDYAALSSSLKAISIPFLIRPSSNASFLQHFVEQSWTHAFLDVQMHGSGLRIFGGYGYTRPPKWWEFGLWRSWLSLNKPEIILKVKLPIPPLHPPSHPPTKPGSGLPSLSDFLTLESFSVSSAFAPVTPRSVPSLIPPHSLSIGRHREPGNANVNVFSIQQDLTYEEPSVGLAQSLPLNGVGRSIIISALASLAHPFSSFVSKFDLSIEPLPFKIALPIHETNNSSALSYTVSEKQTYVDLIPVAEVYASPSLNNTHVRIPLSGHLLPLSNSTSDLAGAISMFVSSYLSYKPAAIAIFTPLYPSLVVRASFPPPSERLKLIRNVTIEHMSIRPTFGSIFVPESTQELGPRSVDPPIAALELLASATVHARVALPPGLNLDIEVIRLWIDCFVFDGDVPKESFVQTAGSRYIPPGESEFDTRSDSEPPVPNPRPLPDPLPERAFARITPRTWLNASSIRIPPEEQDAGRIKEGFKGETGTNVFVTANIVDVPLEVLPGRGDELSKFITKVLFSKDPVAAGLQGVVAVGVGVPGLTSGPNGEVNELTLTGLPFEGNMKVGGHKS